MKLFYFNFLIFIICVILTVIIHCNDFENPYKILGISKSASSDEIKKAYKSLVKLW